MQNEVSITETLNTIFTGGAFVILLSIAVRGGMFVAWVRGQIERLGIDLVRFEKNNDEAHLGIKAVLKTTDKRLVEIEKNGRK